MVRKPGSLFEQIDKHLSNPADFPLEYTAWLRNFITEPANYQGQNPTAATNPTSGVYFNSPNTTLASRSLWVQANANSAATYGTRHPGIVLTTSDSYGVVVEASGSGNVEFRAANNNIQALINASTGFFGVKDYSSNTLFSVLGDGTVTASRFTVAPTGEVRWLGVSGITDNGMRIVGATTSGAPASGTWSVGDAVVDQAGTWWICTVAGTPGTWRQPVANVLTTTGDLLYASAAKVLARRAIGSTGDVLTVSGGLPTWAAPTNSFTNIKTAPAASSASTLALGTAYQNALGYDVMLMVNLNITVNTTGVIQLGVGPTSTPTQQTIATGVTSTGFLPVPIMLPNNYYALLSTSGTITVTIAGQIAMPV